MSGLDSKYIVIVMCCKFIPFLTFIRNISGRCLILKPKYCNIKQKHSVYIRFLQRLKR